MNSKTKFFKNFFIISGSCLFFIGIFPLSAGAYLLAMGIFGYRGGSGDLSGLGIIFGVPIFLIGGLLFWAGHYLLTIGLKDK